jgi:hypothetical protein
MNNEQPYKQPYQILIDALVCIIDDAIEEIEEKHYSSSEKLYDAVATAKKALKEIGWKRENTNVE